MLSACDFAIAHSGIERCARPFATVDEEVEHCDLFFSRTVARVHAGGRGLLSSSLSICPIKSKKITQSSPLFLTLNLTLDARYHYLQTRPCLSGWRFSYERLSQDHHKVRVEKLRLKRFLPGASGERVLLAPGVEPCALKVSRFPKPARVAPG